MMSHITTEVLVLHIRYVKLIPYRMCLLCFIFAEYIYTSYIAKHFNLFFPPRKDLEETQLFLKYLDNLLSTLIVCCYEAFYFPDLKRQTQEKYLNMKIIYRRMLGMCACVRSFFEVIILAYVGLILKRKDKLVFLAQAKIDT